MFPDATWTALYTHSLDLRDGPLDDESFFMLALEQGLLDQGVEVSFDPIRPGEADRYNGGYLRPIRLLVPTHQLDRARVVLEELESAPPLSDEELERQALGGDGAVENDGESPSREHWSST